MSLKETRIASLRNAFFAGLLLLAPITVTWMVFSWLVQTVGGGVRPLFFPESLQDHPHLQFLWDVGAMLAVIVLITVLGWLSRYVFGQFFANLAERLVLNIPGINAIYNTVKQVVDTFGPHKKAAFNKVVLLEFPRKGVWTLGFVTNTEQGEMQAKTGRELWSVFVPTTPNPTGGYMLMVPREELIELSMSVGDGMKMVISGGAVLPPGQGETVN